LGCLSFIRKRFIYLKIIESIALDALQR